MDLKLPANVINDDMAILQIFIKSSNLFAAVYDCMRLTATFRGSIQQKCIVNRKENTEQIRCMLQGYLKIWSATFT